MTPDWFDHVRSLDPSFERHGQRLADALAGVPPTVAVRVPGRIEVLGKHTDYGGGRSLLCALERGLSFVAAPRRDAVLSVCDTRTGETVSCRLDGASEAVTAGWRVYPETVARRLRLNFPGLTGADVAVASDLPLAAGMSSSSALVVGLFLSLARINRLAERDEFRQAIGSTEDLATYISAIEMGGSWRNLAGDAGVGTAGGSEDHVAIMCSRPGQLIRYAFRPTRFEGAVVLPAGYRFAVGTSGVAAEKTGAALESYNRAARTLLAAESLLGGGLTAGRAADEGPLRVAAIRAQLSAGPGAGDFRAAELADRFTQFAEESATIIPAAHVALERQDVAVFGTLVDRSTQLAEDLLGNQIPETVALQRSARELGAAAASAFGAGFGGSVWALVESDRGEAFLQAWRSSYLARFPHRQNAEFFVSEAGPPAREWAFE